MLKVGLTGGIGSGKSTVARLFRLLGFPVFDADSETKKLYHTDPLLKAALEKYFGPDIYRDGLLDRARLSALVFSDPQQLELLNTLVHPRAIAAAEAWMAQQQASYVVKEAALLFESGSAAGLDRIIGVSAPQHLRLQRAMQRDGASREEVLSRMQRQIEEPVKMRLCEHVILNDEQQLLIPQVLALHQQLLAAAI